MAANPFNLAGQMVRCLLTEENEADTVEFLYANSKYTLRKGKETFVPFEAMVRHLGDPRAAEKTTTIRDGNGDAMGWLPDRKSEIGRLRLYWGGHDPGPLNFNGVDYPIVEVYDLDGERITTVIEDPEGLNLVQATQSVADQTELLAQLDRQEKMIQEMRRELGMQNEVGSEADLPTDDSVPPLFVGTGNGQ